MNPHASLLSAARAAGATVLETPGAIVLVLPVAPVAPAAGDLLPLVDAARTAATSVRVLRNAIRAGELAAVGRQRDRAVRRADLEAWIEGRRVVGSGKEGDETEAAVERILARKKAEKGLNSPGKRRVHRSRGRKMSPEFRAAERVVDVHLTCAECGGEAEGNVTYSDGSGELCDACAEEDDKA